MNIFKKLFRSEEKAPTKDGYFDKVTRWIDTPLSNIRVGSETQAMRIATVFRCASILGGSIASLPFQVKRKKLQGFFTVDEDNPINYLLTERANSRLTSYELIKNAVIQMVNRGNAYIYPRYDSGNLKELILLSPFTTTYDTLNDVYIVSDMINNIHGTFDSDSIIHLKNISLDGGYTGVSTIYYASNVLSVGAAAEERNLQSFQPGATNKGFVTGENSGTKGFGDIQDNQLETVSDRVAEELSSGKNITYLSGDMKFVPLAMSPADIQLLETKKFNVLEICRFYGVHPDKVFAGQSQNYKASEMGQVQFLTDTLQPLLRQIEAEFKSKLIPRAYSSKYKLEFDLTAFYQTDLLTMATYMEKNIQYGTYTVNEWRMAQGKAPISGGDVAFISCNVAPIDSKKIKGEK